MTDRQVREANVASAAVVVMTADLGRVLWANSAAATLFGVPVGDRSHDGAANAPLRQVRAAHRLLARDGVASVGVRRPGDTGPVRAANLRLFHCAVESETDDTFALVSVDGIARDSASPQVEAARLAAEAGDDAIAAYSAGALVRIAGRTAEDDDRLADDTAIRAAIEAHLADSSEIGSWSEAGEGYVICRLGPQSALVLRDQDARSHSEPSSASRDDAVAEADNAERSAVEGTLPTPGDVSVTSPTAKTTRVHSRWDETRMVRPVATVAETAIHPAAIDGSETQYPSEAGTAETSLEGDAPSVRHTATGDAPGSAPIPAGPDAGVDPDGSVTMASHEEPGERSACREGEAVENADRLETDFSPDFDAEPQRFVWRLDSANRFRSLSPDFARMVGPRAANVIGLTFEAVAEAFGLDSDGAIRQRLERRDTWSRQIVEWPIDGSDRRAPVDLAALPVYARDRSFDGFRGFGIVRMRDANPSPASDTPVGDEHDWTRDVRRRLMAPGAPSHSGDEPGGAVAFGRRDPVDRPAQTAGDVEIIERRRSATKVIRLDDRRRVIREADLSEAEQDAFRAIGARIDDEMGRGSFTTKRLSATTVMDGRRNDTIVDAAGLETVSTFDGAPHEPAADHRPRLEPGPTSDAPAMLPVAPSDTNALDALAMDRAAIPEGSDAMPDGITSVDRDGTTHDGSEAKDEATESLPGGESEDFGGFVNALETAYSGLPVPILASSRDALVFANREFLDLTGYDETASLEAAGGLDALFVPAEDDGANPAGAVTLARIDGTRVHVRSHLKRATFAGRSCLVMAFYPSAKAAANALLPEREPQAAAETATSVADASGERLDAQDNASLRHALDVAADGLAHLTEDGSVTWMNAKGHALFGFEDGALNGRDRDFATLFAHESQRTVLDAVADLVSGDVAIATDEERDVIGRGADGAFVPVALRLGVPHEGAGLYAAVRDISRRKHAEENLVHARREAEAASLQKSQFLANVSHELRTPLNAILGFADVMATESFGPLGSERYLEYLDDIKRSGHHVLDLVNDLLDISKIEAGKLDLTFEAVSLAEVAGEVVALMQPEANRSQVIVRSNLPSDVAPVVADRRSIRQITLNLIANAVRFTPEGGQIVVSTKVRGDGGVILRVRDTGVGMSEDEIALAMMPFRQVRPKDGQRGEGTGLGLPLTKAMVEANRAQFEIASTPGEGTLVEVAFDPQRVLND